jgi:uncharacterized FlaG/YvyC family protein
MAQSLDAVPAATAPAASGGVQTGTGRSPIAKMASADRNIAAVQAAVEQIRKILAGPARRLEFRADSLTGVVVVAIRDTLTGEEIRSIEGNALIGFADLLTARSDAPRGLIDLTA